MVDGIVQRVHFEYNFSIIWTYCNIYLNFAFQKIYNSTSQTIDALMKLELPSGVEVEIKL